jgi:hypothetical protein
MYAQTTHMSKPRVEPKNEVYCARRRNGTGTNTLVLPVLHRSDVSRLADLVLVDALCPRVNAVACVTG